jgi:hypothetical protein
MGNEQKVKVNGFITFWTLCDRFNLYRAGMAFENAGLGSSAPGERSISEVIRAALTNNYSGRGVHVSPMGNKGFAAIGTAPVEMENGERDVVTNTVCRAWAKYDEYGNAQIEVRPAEEEPSVREWITREKGIVDSKAMSAALIRSCEKLGGISLRPSGGIYWLPEDALEAWNILNEGVVMAQEKAQDMTTFTPRLYIVRTMDDLDSVTAIAESFEREMAQRVKEIAQDVQENTDMSPRALENRVQKCVQIEELIKRYEENLGRQMTAARAKLEYTQTVVSDALLSQSFNG